MPRPTNPRKREADRKYHPHRVDIAVPPGGLGARLNDMLAWCRENVPAGEWDQHGYSEKRAGEVPVDFVRFYFATAESAAAFRHSLESQIGGSGSDRETHDMREE